MSVYRPGRDGSLAKLDAANLESSWVTPPGRYRAQGRVATTRMVRRAVEDGWPVSPAMKAVAMHALGEVLADRGAGPREKVAAVAALIGATRVNVSIDQAEQGAEVMTSAEYGTELRARIAAYEADPEPDAVPDRASPASMDAAPMETEVRAQAHP